MLALVAAIRRLPGGSFAKTARSPSMHAVPIETAFENLSTYFQPWPKRKAMFLLYGSCGRAFSGGEFLGGVRGEARSSAVVGQVNQQHVLDIHDGDQMQLYGPALDDADGSNGGAAHNIVPAATDGVDRDVCGGSAGVSGVRATRVAFATSGSDTSSGPSGASTRALGLTGVLRRFQRKQKLTMVTAYDFPSARFARCSGVEMVLVGDSLGNCRLGLSSTVGVTMEDMRRAVAAVRAGVDAPPHAWMHAGGGRDGGVAVRDSGGGPRESLGPRPVVVGDMPFGSYLTVADALHNAAALRIAGADLIKLEGGKQMATLVRKLTNAGIAVMAHVGLEPQHAILQGGLKLQGTTAPAALEIVRDAQALAAAGAVAMVLECVPAEVGRAVQAAIPSVPVIGIGAGGEVAGQVLVCDDLLGVHGSPPPFVKQYADHGSTSAVAYAAYVAEVRSGKFPAAPHMRRMQPDEVINLRKLLLANGMEDPFQEKQQCQEVVFPQFGRVAEATAIATAKLMPKRTLELRSGNVLHSCQLRAVVHVAGAPPPRELSVLQDRQQLRDWRRAVAGRRVALVPTMGNLHEGHLELVDEAKKRADDVLVSIFVNPAQFAAHEDLDRYPRTLQRDLELLNARGVAAAFAPASPAVLYPGGSSPGGTLVVPTFVKGKSEDACRPHFFAGVATVCLKLFNTCQPDVVVFGQKDAMQCAVIGHMLEDLLLEDRIDFVVVPTSREADGLARSSRNSYLTPAMRRKAPAIYAALCRATGVAGGCAGADADTDGSAFVGATTNGAGISLATDSSSAISRMLSARSVRKEVRASLEASDMVVEYVSVADSMDMREREDEEDVAGAIVSVACLLRDGAHQCRLIDNVVLPPHSGTAAL